MDSLSPVLLEWQSVNGHRINEHSTCIPTFPHLYVIYHKTSLQLNLYPNRSIHTGLSPHAEERNVRMSIVAVDVIICFFFLQSAPLVVRRGARSIPDNHSCLFVINAHRNRIPLADGN